MFSYQELITFEMHFCVKEIYVQTVDKFSYFKKSRKVMDSFYRTAWNADAVLR